MKIQVVDKNNPGEVIVRIGAEARMEQAARDLIRRVDGINKNMKEAIKADLADFEYDSRRDDEAFARGNGFHPWVTIGGTNFYHGGGY